MNISPPSSPSFLSNAQFLLLFFATQIREREIKTGFHLILIPTFHPGHVCLQAAGVCSGFISCVRPDTCGDDMYEWMKVEMDTPCLLNPPACVCRVHACGKTDTAVRVVRLYIELQQSLHWYSARVRLFLLQSSLQSGRHSGAHARRRRLLRSDHFLAISSIRHSIPLSGTV